MAAQNNNTNPTLPAVALDLNSPTHDITAARAQAAELIEQIYGRDSDSGSDSDSEYDSDSTTAPVVHCTDCYRPMLFEDGETGDSEICLHCIGRRQRELHELRERASSLADDLNRLANQQPRAASFSSAAAAIPPASSSELPHTYNPKRGRTALASTGTPESTSGSESEEEVVIPRTSARRSVPMAAPWYSARYHRPAPAQPSPWLTPRRPPSAAASAPSSWAYNGPVLIDLTCPAVECPCCMEPSPYLINCSTKNCHYGLCIDCRTQVLLNDSRCPSCRVDI